MNGEVAIVTGGNRGIGLGISQQLVARGMRVVLASRDQARGEAAAAGIEHGGRLQVRTLDVADPGSVARFADGLRRDGATVHALVNNAGASFDGFDADVARKTLDANTFGAAAVTDAVLPLIPEGGRIVMVSSGMGELSRVGEALRARFLDPTLDRAGLQALLQSFVEDVRRGEHRRHGWPSNAYSVSKVGLNALVRVLAPPLRARGILVNAVCPGWVRTDMGGRGAPRSVEEGAAGVVWAATLPPDGPTGGFFRDGRAIAW